MSSEKRTVPIAGVGTERHRSAVRSIIRRAPIFRPSQSVIVCMAVLYTEDSLSQGTVTIEDLFAKFHLAIYGD